MSTVVSKHAVCFVVGNALEGAPIGLVAVAEHVVQAVGRDKSGVTLNVLT